jgi:hypothetical protein
LEAPDLAGFAGAVRGLSFWVLRRWQQIGSKGRLFLERNDGSWRSLRQGSEVEFRDRGAHVLDAVQVRVDRERRLDVGMAEDLLRDRRMDLCARKQRRGRVAERVELLEPMLSVSSLT